MCHFKQQKQNSIATINNKLAAVYIDFVNKNSPNKNKHYMLKENWKKTYYTAPYTRWAKKRGHRLMAIILSILNQFKKFFHWKIPW